MKFSFRVLRRNFVKKKVEIHEGFVIVIPNVNQSVCVTRSAAFLSLIAGPSVHRRQSPVLRRRDRVSTGVPALSQRRLPGPKGNQCAASHTLVTFGDLSFFFFGVW